MARSSGLPRKKGLVGMTHVIAARMSPTTVTRVATSKGDLDQTTETTSDHQEDLWLFEPRESLASEIAGERIEGSLGGLAVADSSDPIDIEHNDRVSHGGVGYEVDTVVGHPGEDDPAFWIISFTRRQE